MRSVNTILYKSLMRVAPDTEHASIRWWRVCMKIWTLCGTAGHFCWLATAWSGSWLVLLLANCGARSGWVGEGCVGAASAVLPLRVPSSSSSLLLPWRTAPRVFRLFSRSSSFPFLQGLARCAAGGIVSFSSSPVSFIFCRFGLEGHGCRCWGLLAAAAACFGPCC